ncbi:DHA2 family efflux MFS transporter permease subunit [Streptomyces sp. ISL-100]|uniref:DHA2 family efflux MFS transporter permease subunit n=1 Tax=Streptomyces sp. ISL-100 TaxID=2819173 RepID=UPI001BE4E5F1|nr:DHA2 family efflux MFS transporter permease subunit [Streptomyces sp. ISL-100]MBT2399306.1 DHA2 family efflux MFS transporter permease subunit [Streptomyces sp. ISL-100]
MSEEISTTSTEEEASAEAAPPPGERSPVVVALVLALGAFVALLDTTIVGVAMHSFTEYFDAGLADAQWASTAYLLAMSSVIPATGWAAQRFGATATWIASLTVFLLGSVLCGAAWSLGSLIAFRAVQGLGASMLFPLMRIIVVEVVGRAQMGRMMTMMAVPLLVAPVLGPVLGGTLIQEFSWRWAFFLNVPIVLAVIVLSVRHIPNSKGQAPGRLDLAGLLTMGGGLAAVILGFSNLAKGTSPTSTPVLLPVAVGAVLLAVHGVRAARAQTPGVVDFSLFRDRTFTASTSITLLNNFGLYGVVVLVPLFFQQAGGKGPLGAGAIMVAQGVGTAAAVLLVGRVIDTKSNPRALVLVGLLLVAAGITTFAMADTAEVNALLLAALFAQGIGLALAAAPIMVTLYHSLPATSVPAATTANAVSQQLGGAVGTTVIALLLQHYVYSADGAAADFGPVFWWALVFVAVTAIPALFLPPGTSKQA